MRKLREILIAGLLCFSVFGLAGPVLAFQNSGNTTQFAVSAEVQKERDAILSLLTLAFVHNDWQSPEKRGHNIGSLLVDGDGLPVFWARNSVKILDNSNQHGEVRLATKYLFNFPGRKYLPKEYVLYTSLEPCVMCTGMLSMIQTGRVVFVQRDPEFGGVVEALRNMQPPYPRVYDVAAPMDLKQKKQLDDGWTQFRKQNPDKAITDYLVSDEAKAIYQSARDELASYTLRHQKENADVLRAAQVLATSTLPELLGDAARRQSIWQAGEGNVGAVQEFHPTLFIDYLDWQNRKNMAQVVDDKFYICSEGKCETSDTLEYWNSGRKWTATVARGLFKHTSDDRRHEDGIIVFKSWKGVHKTGSLQPMGGADF